MELKFVRPVVVVCPGGADGNGGMARHVRYTARSWERLALTPPLVVLDSYGRAMPVAFLACALRLLLRLVTCRAGLVHLHMAADGSVVRKLLLARLAACFGVPVILHVHGSRFVDFLGELGVLRRRVLARAMGRASRILVLGEAVRASLLHALALDPASVCIMPNAVPIPPAACPAGEGCRIVFLGRLGPRKGVPELLDALAALNTPDLAWNAVLAGDGEVETSRARVASLGLTGRVMLTGWLDEPEAHRLLARADLLVLPSRNEGQPMAILEAMAAGLPVVASEVGAIPELIRNGENGCLVAPGDANALERALRGLIAEPHERRRLGHAARATIVADHGIDAYCHRLHALYRASARSGRHAPADAVMVVP